MEPCYPCFEPVGWSPPDWLDEHLLTDARFAKAYGALADDRRALLKCLIARQYVLAPPTPNATRAREDRFDLFTVRDIVQPAPFAVLLTEDLFDAPAFFLSALLPVLTARVPQVLVCRLGNKSAVPDSLLVACELCGQESLATMSPADMERLLEHCAAADLPGVVLYPDTPAFRRLLARPALRQALDASSLRLTALRMPRRCGLWRDEPHQFPVEDVAFLYGALAFDCAGAVPGGEKSSPAADAWKHFSVVARDMNLLPHARTGQGRARLTIGEACLGQWRWPEIASDHFTQRRQIFSATT